VTWRLSWSWSMWCEVAVDALWSSWMTSFTPGAFTSINDDDGGGKGECDVAEFEPLVPNLVMAVQLLINYLINIYCIPRNPFLSIPELPFWGPFRCQFQNCSIPPEYVTTGMAILAGPPAKFYSSGFRSFLQESVGHDKDL